MTTVSEIRSIYIYIYIYKYVYIYYWYLWDTCSRALSSATRTTTNYMTLPVLVF